MSEDEATGRTQYDVIHELVEKLDGNGKDKQLEKRVDEIEEQLQKLEELIGKLSDEVYSEELERLNSAKREETETEEKSQETEDEESGKYPLDKDPSDYGKDTRMNFIIDWFKKQGKFHKANTYEVLESVFGYNAQSAQDSEYVNVRQTMRKDPRFVTPNQRTNPQKYKLSNKVKRHD